ncbi:MAG: putative beta-barrel assembly-enhancing protease [marine bacterium B5-7]|nr:MAG: putative beta-barrel assembly-enhancing protease [marine bacterium B5-7]
MTIQRTLFISIALVVALTSSVNAGQQQLPALGDPSMSIINSNEEQRLGRQFMRSALVQMNFTDDPETRDYIRDLGDRLVESIGLSASDFTFSVIIDPHLNAFAVPGGFITVHTGLITTTETESELASVIAHEIAHITQRHLPRMIERSKQRSLPAAAAMVAAILLGGQAGSAALVGANAAVVADQLRYSRDFEQEADAVGIRILAASGFNPQAMPAFFLKLEKSSTVQASEVPEYLRTHPLSVARVADSEARAANYPVTKRDSSESYYFVRARTRALTDDDPKRVADYFASVDTVNETDAAAARYGQALALSRTGDFASAKKIFNELTRTMPNNLYINLAVAQLELRRGASARAVAFLESLYNEDPANSLLAQYYSEALLAAKRPDDSYRVLRKWQRSEPKNAVIYKDLSRVYGETGRRAESFQALAEYFALRFQPNRAIDELERARQYSTGNYYLTSSINARVKELTEEMQRYDELIPPK